LNGEFLKVTSAVITLNGVVIIGPNEFNPHVTIIEKPVTLASSNTLTVELRGKPGSGLTLQIIGQTTNTPPTANAGPDQTVFVGTTVTLDGSASSDADGNPLTHHWSLTSRPAGSLAALSNPTAVKPTFLVDVPGTWADEKVDYPAISNGSCFCSSSSSVLKASFLFA
jgi:hypothetical protein